MICIIAAASKNGVIGCKGHIPWDIPEDKLYFRRTTEGSAVIMGRKTYEEIGRPLPNRLNIVISSSRNFCGEMLMTAKDLTEAISISEKYSKEHGSFNNIFLCGGRAVYKEGLKIADRIYLTVLDKEYCGDVYFPEFDHEIFTLVSSERCDKAGITFFIYERKDTN